MRCTRGSPPPLAPLAHMWLRSLIPTTDSFSRLLSQYPNSLSRLLVLSGSPPAPPHRLQAPHAPDRHTFDWLTGRDPSQSGM